jgi:hypothetical protein
MADANRHRQSLNIGTVIFLQTGAVLCRDSPSLLSDTVVGFVLSQGLAKWRPVGQVSGRREFHEFAAAEVTAKLIDTRLTTSAHVAVLMVCHKR